MTVAAVPFRLRRPPGVAMAGALVCGLAAWATVGSIAVTGDATSSRVALAAAWWVPAVTTAALLVLGALALIPSGAWWPTLVPAVLLLPWLPVPVPAAFLGWAGPVTTWVWVATAAAVASAAWTGRPAGRWLRDPKRAACVALAVSLVAALAAAARERAVLPGGDAPHYLVITQSLLRDGDLRIENNHRQLDYLAYYSADLSPHYLRRGTDGEIYSIHAPGLPALLAPAFAVGGYPGVVAFLVLVAAVGAWLVWRTAFRLTSSAGAAWFAWAATSLSAPFFLHSFQVFPDASGAVLTMFGVSALVALDVERRPASCAGPEPNAGSRAPAAGSVPVSTLLLAGVALAALPWLHTRYAAIAAVLGISLVWRLVGLRRYQAAAAFLTVPVLSAVAWFGFFYSHYGSFSPAAPYASYTQSSLANVGRGLPGLLLDQQFGLVANAPVLAIAFIGLAIMSRTRVRLAVELGALVLVYFVAVSAYAMWWGGWSSPARFAVPVLLALGVPAADFWARRSPSARAAALVALAVSLLATVAPLAAEDGRAIFNSRDGFSRWLDWVAPLVDLPRALPSFLRAAQDARWLQAGIWAAAMLLGWLALRGLAARIGDPALRRAGLAVAAPCVFAVAAMMAATLAWQAAGAKALTPATAQLELLRRYDESLRPAGIRYKPLRAATAAEVVQRLRLATSTRRQPRQAAPLQLSGVPAGLYRLRGVGVARYRALEVRIGRSQQPLERWALDEMTAPPECLIRLPVGVTALTVTGEPRAGGPSPDLELQPLSVRREPPHHAPAPSGLDALASRAARYGQLTVFTFDQLVYLEGGGFWMTAGRADRVVVAPDSPGRTVSLLARNGEVANAISLRSRDWSATLELAPREERRVTVPLDRASGAVVLEVHAEGGFRPVDFDPQNKDERYLGVWIEPAR